MTTDDESEIADLGAQLAGPNPGSVEHSRFVEFRSVTRECLVRWRAVALSLLLITAVGWFAGLFYCDYRPDAHTNKAATRQVIQAASEDVVALLSYSPDTLSHDIELAKSRVTTEFQQSFKQFTEQVVTPAAQRGQITTTVRVIRAAVAELRPESAVVLMFISQKTMSKEKPQPVITTGAIRVHLRKVRSAWLIAKFDTV